MQFEALKVFCDVARLRSFSQAASVNGLTQSAVSQIVLQLEKRLGVKLVDRSTRPFHLTSQGQVYFEGCRGLVEQYLDLEASIRRAQPAMAPSVQVVAIYSVGLRDMNQYVQQFALAQPHAEVRIEYLHPDLVYRRVLDGTADLGLVSYPKKSRDLSALPWREEQMVLACAPDHPLARRPAIRLPELNGAKWVGFDTNLVIHKKIDALLRHERVRVDPQMRFDNIESIKRAVEVGSGVALLPRPTIEREIEVGTLVGVPLAGPRLVRPLAIIHRSNRHLSQAVSCFLEILRRPEESNGAAPHSRQRAGVGSK